MEMTDHECQLRGRSQVRENICFDSGLGKDACRKSCEFFGIMAAVMSDDNASVHRFLSVFRNVVGNALCRFADHIEIHTVRAGAYFASQSGSAECQILIEPVFDIVIVVRIDIDKVLIQRTALAHIVQPFFIAFSCVHK